MNEKEEIKIADKRASHDDDEVIEKEKTCAAEINDSVSESSVHDEETGKKEKPLSFLSLNMLETANFFVSIILQKAWIELGLIANPETGQAKANFEEARLAIDLLSAINEKMQGKWGVLGMENEINGQLANLRLNYARLADSSGH